MSAKREEGVAAPDDDKVMMTAEAMKGEWNQRTQYLLGEIGVKALRDACVAIVGVGGVGAYAAEMVARSLYS